MKVLNRTALLNALEGLAATLDEAEVTLRTTIASLRNRIHDHIVELLGDGEEDGRSPPVTARSA